MNLLTSIFEQARKVHEIELKANKISAQIYRLEKQAEQYNDPDRYLCRELRYKIEQLQKELLKLESSTLKK